jgi:hypothetical protein
LALVKNDGPKLMHPDEAARALEKALEPKGKFTVADAAEKSGLALRDAEAGLFALVSKYRGHLGATEEGQVLFSFPHGFSQPWVVRGAVDRAISAVGRGALGAARFVVRAWIAIVLVGYTALFVALLIALTFSGSSRSDDRGRGSFRGIDVVFRVLFEAFYWWWHPFSPFRAGYYAVGAAADTASYGGSRRRGLASRDEPSDEEPFYQKVDRFFFGPTEPPPDPLETERKLVAEIRAKKGRIGIGDVMAVTGLPRDEANALISKLMLDYDGDVFVSDDGGIVYRFKELRRTARSKQGPADQPPRVWARPKAVPPLTGNGFGTNLLIAVLNGFNLVMSLFALSSDLTLSRVLLLLQKVPLDKIPFDGTPIALGVVPLVFSLALFALPLVRAAVRPLKARRIARENGRLALLREALGGAKKGGVTDEAVKAAWEQAAGEAPSDREITRQIVALGGDVDTTPDGKVRYRFPDLEAEAKALLAEREAAAEAEADAGKEVFSSEN